MNKIIAIIGEAGAGKDYLVKKIMENHSDTFHEIISYTTRPIREGEQDGVNYHFVSPEEFEYLIANNKMLEYTNFRDWYYGTCIYDLSKTKINIGVFNPAGIRNLLKNNNINVEVIRLVARDKTRLLRQLNREYNPDCFEIIRRFQTDKEDFRNLDFDYMALLNESDYNLEDNITIITHLANMVIDYNDYKQENGQK